MSRRLYATPALTVLAVLSLHPTAAPAGAPTGVWYDHTGRGAVEIKACGGGLCGHIVWLKDAKHNKVCGTQIIGNAKPAAGGSYDKGWIYDPNTGGRFSVEITPQGGSLRVLGYMGNNKSLSRTMTWTRAPGGLQRCKA